jgi:hypothetical protein
MPTVVQSVTGTASNTTGVLDLTFPDPTTSGNTILVFAGSVSGAYPSAATCTIGGVTDHFAQSGPASVSGTFYGGTGVPLAIATWADPGCAGGQTAIAASNYASAGFYYNAGVAYEISGLTASPLDSAGATPESASSASSSWSASGSGTAQASEIWLGFVLGTGSVTITGPGSPWTDTATLTISGNLAAMGGYKVVAATGTPSFAGTFGSAAYWGAAVITLKGTSGAGGTGSVALPVRHLSGTGLAGIAGTGSVRLPPRRLAAAAAEVFTGAGSLRMPARSLAGGSYSDFTGTGGVTMPARSLSGTAKESFQASGGVVLPATSSRISGVALVNPGMILAPRALAGTGYVSPVGSGGVIMPARALAGTAEERILAAGPPVLPARSLIGAGTETFPGTGSLAMPARRLAGTGNEITAGGGGVALPARHLSGAGTETITGTGSVRAAKFTLSGTVGEQPRGSGGVVMPKMALSGGGKLPVLEVWRTPDKVHKSGAVMS